MGTNLHDVYYCQMNRTQELSNRLYDRNLPSHQMGQSYFARPVDTYATVFPVLDCHKPSTVNKAQFPQYNQQLMFNPGQGAPFEGYSNNVDVESLLHNSFHPNQKCVQGKYVPGSKSDMYNSPSFRESVQMTNNLLFKKEQFNSFNPNECNLGYKMFNNHIRVQTKNIELSSENTENTENTEKTAEKK
jgi:hypothetical protein